MAEPKAPFIPPASNLNASSPKQQRGVEEPKNAESIIITEILPDDILLGRGALAISNTGNVRFRVRLTHDFETNTNHEFCSYQSIIADRKDEYISTSRRLKKDTIANEIRALIASRNGRFLRRATPEERREIDLTRGKDAWAIADEDVVLAKIKQSLRDKETEERDMIEKDNKRTYETSFDQGKRARMRGCIPALNWNEPHIATDRPLQPMIRGDYDGDIGANGRDPQAQERILEEELLRLRERQRLLLDQSLILGASAPGASNPLARYQQMELLPPRAGSVLDSQSLDQHLGMGLLPQALDPTGGLQDSSRSSQSEQDTETLRREIERRSQIEVLLKQREEELLLRLLEQERDASLNRLRRQEALLAAIRQGKSLADIDSSSLLFGGVVGDFRRDNSDFLRQSDILARPESDLTALLAARGAPISTSTDPLSLSLLGHNHASLRDDVQLGQALNRKEAFDSQKANNAHGQFGKTEDEN